MTLVRESSFGMISIKLLILRRYHGNMHWNDLSSVVLRMYFSPSCYNYLKLSWNHHKSCLLPLKNPRLYFSTKGNDIPNTSQDFLQRTYLIPCSFISWNQRPPICISLKSLWCIGKDIYGYRQFHFQFKKKTHFKTTYMKFKNTLDIHNGNISITHHMSKWSPF